MRMLDYEQRLKYEIARELGISPKTVETHCRRMRERLGLRSQRALVLLAAKWAGGGGG